MEPLLRPTLHTDWITIIIILSLVFLVLAKSLFYHRFLNFIMLPFNNKYLFLYNKKDVLNNWFHIFLSCFQLLNFALYIYYVKDILYASEKTDSIYIYLLIFAFLFFYLLIKIFFQLGNGFVFNSSKIFAEIIFKKLSYLNHSGSIMLLANILLSYVLIDSKTVVYLSLATILLINVIGWVTVLRNHQNFVMTNFFYFILYLCALEIAPLIIIGSYLKD